MELIIAGAIGFIPKNLLIAPFNHDFVLPLILMLEE